MGHAATHLGPPVVAVPSQGDQVVVLRDVPWEQYDALCRAREHRAGPRMAYLDGALEIMSPAPKHESDKKMIARLLECYALEEGLSLNALGSTTYSSEGKKAGLEPDECYILGGGATWRWRGARCSLGSTSASSRASSARRTCGARPRRCGATSGDFAGGSEAEDAPLRVCQAHRFRLSIIRGGMGG
jgi:hypothetical protein